MDIMTLIHLYINRFNHTNLKNGDSFCDKYICNSNGNCNYMSDSPNLTCKCFIFYKGDYCLELDEELFQNEILKKTGKVEAYPVFGPLSGGRKVNVDDSLEPTTTPPTYTENFQQPTRPYKKAQSTLKLQA